MVKNVALVSPGWPVERTPSGIAAYVRNLKGGLSALGIAPRVISMSAVEPEHLASDIADASPGNGGAQGFVGKVLRRLNRAIDPMSEIPREGGLAIARTLSKHPDLQLVEIEESFGFSGWMKSVGMPVVVRLHGPWFINGPAYGVASNRDFARRCELEFRGMEVAAGITAPSRAVLEQTLARLRKPPLLSAVIPNPVNVGEVTDKWSASSMSPGRILYVGRFDRIKGPDILFKAFARVLTELPRSELCFVGPDYGFRDDAGTIWSIENYLSTHVSALVRKRITVMGTQPPQVIEKLRRSCNVAVIASRQETYPLAAVESLCAGTPTLGPRIGGVPEVIADEETGLLFRVEDPEHLASQLLRILNEPRLADALSSAAHASAGRFHPAAVARETASFYEKVLASRGSL